jgi:acetolactate synthase-1/3 small subunit
MKHTHIIGMLVEDQPGVLARIAGMFSRRGFNIDTITVGKTSKPGVSKMVFTIIGDDRVLEQVEKQVNKLVDVIKVIELPPMDSIIIELCLVKVNIADEKAKDDLLKYANIYKAKIVDITPKSVIFRLVGSTKKIDSFIELLKKYGIKDISRTGVTAIDRDNKTANKK